MALTGSITQANATVFATPQGAFLPPGSPEVRHFAENLYEGYFQDSWKVKRNVNITLGLHYTYETPPWEANGFEVRPTTDLMQWFTQREIGMNRGIPSDASPLLSWGLAGSQPRSQLLVRPHLQEFCAASGSSLHAEFEGGLLNSLLKVISPLSAWELWCFL
jgi:hypothetical protein